MPSVALVVLDTLRYDQFVDHFDWLDGLRFRNAYSTSHWTGAAHASLLTGRYPSEVDVTVKSRAITCDAPLLYERLRDAGYTTRVFTNNLQIHEWAGWDRGVDDLVGRGRADLDPVPEGAVDWANREFGATTRPGRYARGLLAALRSDHATLPSLVHGYRIATRDRLSSARAVRNRVRATEFGDREFLLCNVMDTHAPYYTPDLFSARSEAPKPTIEDGLADAIADPASVRRAYEACAASLSEEYRGLFDALREAFDCVVTLSDHGELLGERGHWAHNHGLDPAVTHVPLVVSGDGIPTGTCETPVSLLDVHRTVADLAGIEVESRGQDLLADPEPVPRLVEYHGLARKRFERFEEYGIESLFPDYDRPLDALVTADGYAYRTVEDGLLTRGALGQAAAEERLESCVSELDRRPLTVDDRDVPASVRQRLEELGYT